jgi:hypothetical protein
MNKPIAHLEEIYFRIGNISYTSKAPLQIIVGQPLVILDLEFCPKITGKVNYSFFLERSTRSLAIIRPDPHYVDGMRVFLDKGLVTIEACKSGNGLLFVQSDAFSNSETIVLSFFNPYSNQ